MPDSPITLRVGTYNLRDGGLDNLADHNQPGDVGIPDLDISRLRKQLAMLSRYNFDLLGLQEAKWGVHSRDLENLVAAELGMTWSFVGPSNYYGCDLATFVRTGDNLTVEHVEHLTCPPLTHALTNVTLRVTGRSRPVHFLVGHSAPGAPGTRLLEAQLAAGHRKLDAIYVADFNAVALGDAPDIAGLDPYQVEQKLDIRPAQQLAAAGFLDVGEYWGDPTPTVGHHGTDKIRYRADRPHTTLPPDSITGYGVVMDGDELSDHRAVWAKFTIPPQREGTR